MTINDFQYLITEYGTMDGWAYTDESKSALFIIFEDKIAIHSNFLVQRIFEIFEDEDEDELSISKSALNKTSDAMVSADMEDEDWDVVYLHWEKLLHDLKYVKQLEKLNIGETIRELLNLVIDNGKALATIPEKIEANPLAIWEIVDKSLKQADLLTAFYWEDWATKGIPALNNLSALKKLKVQINQPTEEEEEEIGTTLYYTTAILNFFNKQLESHSLTIVAIGAQFEELQTFVVISGNESVLEGITAKLDQLCLKFEY